MKPQEKAEHIYNDYWKLFIITMNEKDAYIHAKNSALKCCDIVTNNVIQGGHRWHEFQQIKSFIQKM